MTDQVLIEGCSYVEMFSLHNQVNRNNTFNWDNVFGRIDTDHYDIRGGAGSGNHVIAMRTLHAISKQTYQKVIIVWSGINRIDAVVPRRIHDLQDQRFDYISILDDLVYYHCGGYLGTGNTKMPRVLDQYFDLQFKGSTNRYLTDLTLHNVIATQSILSARGIDYEMGWMYDIHRDYTDSIWWPGCGQIDTTSPLMNLVDWSKINDRSALEWCLERGMMYPDGFHWSWEGGHQWFRDVMGEEIYRS